MTILYVIMSESELLLLSILFNSRDGVINETLCS